MELTEGMGVELNEGCPKSKFTCCEPNVVAKLARDDESVVNNGKCTRNWSRDPELSLVCRKRLWTINRFNTVRLRYKYWRCEYAPFTTTNTISGGCTY